MLEKDELRDDGDCFKVLRKGPEVVTDQGSVKTGMEDHCHQCRPQNQVPRFDTIHELIVG